jgi:hypothetical protein
LQSFGDHVLISPVTACQTDGVFGSDRVERAVSPSTRYHVRADKLGAGMLCIIALLLKGPCEPQLHASARLNFVFAKGARLHWRGIASRKLV